MPRLSHLITSGVAAPPPLAPLPNLPNKLRFTPKTTFPRLGGAQKRAKLAHTRPTACLRLLACCQPHGCQSLDRRGPRAGGGAHARGDFGEAAPRRRRQDGPPRRPRAGLQSLGRGRRRERGLCGILRDGVRHRPRRGGAGAAPGVQAVRRGQLRRGRLPRGPRLHVPDRQDPRPGAARGAGAALSAHGDGARAARPERRHGRLGDGGGAPDRRDGLQQGAQRPAGLQEVGRQRHRRARRQRVHGGAQLPRILARPGGRAGALRAVRHRLGRPARVLGVCAHARPFEAELNGGGGATASSIWATTRPRRRRRPAQRPEADAAVAGQRRRRRRRRASSPRVRCRRSAPPSRRPPRRRRRRAARGGGARGARGAGGGARGAAVADGGGAARGEQAMQAAMAAELDAQRRALAAQQQQLADADARGGPRSGSARCSSRASARRGSRRSARRRSGRGGRRTQRRSSSPRSPTRSAPRRRR